MRKVTHRGVIAARSLVGFVFLVSALLKAAELRQFGVLISLYNIVKEPSLVMFVAGGVVAVELILGVLAIFGVRMRGLTQGLIILMLAGLSAVFAYGYFAKGITDCGCFGSAIKLSPAVSIAKNLVLIALSLFVLLKERATPSPAFMPPRSLAGGLCAAAALLAFAAAGRPTEPPTGVLPGPALSPAAVSVTSPTAIAAAVSTPAPAATPVPDDPTRPFASFSFSAEGQVYDLSRGRWFIPFLSATCEHCKHAVEVLNLLPTMQPELPPIVAIMMGSPAEIDAFRAETSPQFPIHRAEDLEFMQMITNAPPNYFLVDEGAAVAQWHTDLPADADLAQAIFSLPPAQPAP